MSVIDRAALEDSPLADLHEIASELSIDGYRRVRRADLIEAILAKQEGREVESAPEADEPSASKASKSRSSTSKAPKAKASTSKGSGKKLPTDDAGDETTSEDAGDESDSDDEPSQSRRRRGRRGGRGRITSASAEEDSDADAGDEEPERAQPSDRARDSNRARQSDRSKDSNHGRDSSRAKEPDSAKDSEPDDQEEDQIIEGVVELLGNGSGFVRVEPPDPSDDDVYISAAQVKRCELVSGDRIAGPRRRPRRSERFASLIKIDKINGRPAAELADGARFDELATAFPSERFKLGSEDPTVKAIEWLTPFGKGSRVSIVGPARSGKSQALRRLAGALAESEGIELSIVLAGVRPEEISDWSTGSKPPVASVALGASSDAQGTAIEAVIDQSRRLAARGADVVVLIDTLDGASPHAARKALASARNIVDGGSLTVIATTAAPLGGETTVIALDAGLTATGRFPAVDLVASGTMRPELLVGEAGADVIARARIEAGEG
jgi:transcription termination factor Rho